MHSASFVSAGLIILSCVAVTASAQQRTTDSSTYPNRPVRVVVGVSPGGGLDSITRLVAQKVGERMGQTFVVDNRPGAASTIAMKIVADAPADGYTLMSGTKTAILNDVLGKVPFDMAKAYTPVAHMTTQIYVLVVNPAMPVKSINELLAYAKSKPGALNYGSAGTGSIQHVGMELFKSMAAVKMEHVPYKGGGTAIIDLLSGQIQLMPSVTTTVAPHLKTGKLRAIAVTSKQRIEIYPELPTVSESGVPGFELTNIYALYAPARTPDRIVVQLNREVGRAMNMPEMKKILDADGVQVPPQSNPEEFKDTVVKELRLWKKFIMHSKLKL